MRKYPENTVIARLAKVNCDLFTNWKLFFFGGSIHIFYFLFLFLFLFLFYFQCKVEFGILPGVPGNL